MAGNAMGDEIDQRHFEADHFSQFRARLEEETYQLDSLFKYDQFSQRGDILGFELEVCIIDQEGHPSGINRQFLDQLNDPLVVPELAEFNVELNGSPVSLTGRVFSRLLDELSTTWHKCVQNADDLNVRLVTVGILPTINPGILNSDHMSDMVRYYALNDRVMALRDGEPLQIEIAGEEQLQMKHADVMLESAATSFQIHVQCKPERATRDFNAALVASAPMVALSANSPTLFGKFLWEETRIPLFEQSVQLGGRYLDRVSFGSGYVDESLSEVFQENQRDHVLLLPYVQSDPVMKFAHLRFQNGTIWRWNRPLIGFDYDGQPHVRIEHRVVPAGPTCMDCIANLAMFTGLLRAFSDATPPVAEQLTFEQTKENFYQAARHGLNATFHWPKDRQVNARELILNELIPAGRDALNTIPLPREEIDRFLDVIVARVESEQTGAQWQRCWIDAYGKDFAALTRRYADHQGTEKPVHEWPIS
ncbi:MAG: glutamate--cysteine ligase [Gammaproteobacteria bacterium]|nr:glutamate--cysteine ligase [Gammaproteobacteria bacterium]